MLMITSVVQYQWLWIDLLMITNDGELWHGSVLMMITTVYDEY